MRFLALGVAAAFFRFQYASAIDLDINDQNSIKDAAKNVTGDIMTLYHSSDKDNIGIFEAPYYWWESGAVWDAFIDYWFLTGDDQYNDQVSASLFSQAGQDLDFMPTNQTKDEGNSDQAFWGLAAMSAAERSFPVPSGLKTWESLAQRVFEDQVVRWDNKTCAGGLRWQIYPFNAGYDYKNSFSNGLFFQLAARLAQYTGNQTYHDWATEAYTWMQTVGMIDADFRVWDGTTADQNCSTFNHIQWSANLGPILYGSAVMYNLSSGAEQSTWQSRVQGLLGSANVWWSSSNASQTNILVEVACEPQHNCDTDQKAFKGLFATALAQTAYYVPSTASRIAPVLQASAPGAAQACSGKAAATQSACGLSWRSGGYDGDTGLGQELAALSVMQANLIPGGAKLATASDASGTSDGGNGTSTTGSGSSSSPAPTTSSTAPPNAGAVMGVSGLLAMGTAALWILL